MSEIPSFIVQQRALEEIGHELHDLLVEGDESILYVESFLGPMSHGNVWAVRPNGQHVSPKGRANSLSLGRKGFAIGNALDRLREACNVEGKGTWFGIAVTVMPDGAVTAEYNYDTEFEWNHTIEPTLFVREQEMFPRDLEHQPEWFQRRLAEGRVALEEYRRDPKGYYDRM